MRRAISVLAATSMVLTGVAGCARREDGCAALQEYQGMTGQTVSLLGETDVAPAMRAALQGFTRCTGIQVDVRTPEGGRAVAVQLNNGLASGRPPEVALVNHDQFTRLMRRKVLKVAPASVNGEMATNFSESWRRLMGTGDAVYGVPVDLEMKSVVWYSPSQFAAKGMEPPDSWEELKALTQQIAGAGLSEGTRPWCAGFAAAAQNSGWPGTDWLEDTLLRTAGTAVYDRWVKHQIPFNDPQVVGALGEVSWFLRNPRFSNGGLGGPAGIAETPFVDAGRPVLTGECYLHRQGNLYGWPDGTSVGPEGDVWAFYLPGPEAATERPILGTGSIAAVLSDEPRARALQTYLATVAFAQARAAGPDGSKWVSANRAVDPEVFPTALTRQVSSWLSADDATFRYDGSDEMPESIARKVFWQAMTTWAATGRSDGKTLDAVERQWP